jgi:hypothetical protein
LASWFAWRAPQNHTWTVKHLTARRRHAMKQSSKLHVGMGVHQRGEMRRFGRVGGDHKALEGCPRAVTRCGARR